jgi:hypothetical protein
MSILEAKRQAQQVMSYWATGAKCVDFETSTEPGYDYEGLFEFPKGEPGLFRFWTNTSTGNLLFLEAK